MSYNLQVLVSALSVAVAAPGGFYGLVAHPNGAVVPVDEPAVAAARADHLASHGAAYAGHIASYGAGPAAYAAGPAAYAAGPVLDHAAIYNGPLHYPTLVAHPNGAVVPADEPAVVAARADHLAAHGAAYAAYAPAYAHAAYAPAAYAGGYFGGLVAHPNGAVVPVDEPAVQAARADHLAAKAAIGH